MAKEVLRFHPGDAAFNRENALYLAHASSIAYARSPARVAEDTLGLKTVPFQHKFVRTRGYLGVCDTHAVLAFRGTEPITLPNWLTDAVVKLVKTDDYDGRVHFGFSSVLKQTWPKLSTVLEQIDGRPLFVTGHSLGGALAVLAACRLAKSVNTPVATYTFGAPRVGDPEFCAGYALPTYRVVYGLDVVPEMPMPSLTKAVPVKMRFASEKLLSKLMGIAERVPCYGHVNTFVYIDRDGVLTMNADIEPWHAHAVSRALATRGRSFHEGITDHLLGSYIRGLEGRPGKRVTTARRRSVGGG